MSGQTFDLILPGITREQKEAVRQLFHEGGSGKVMIVVKVFLIVKFLHKFSYSCSDAECV